jgi:pimeloyl-ACP methyl ester carboxylesterase
MLNKIILGLLVVSGLGALGTWWAYQDFSTERRASLEAGSQVIATSEGLIEYQLAGGSEPVLLFIHGTPGGYDAVGFGSVPGLRTLMPSRPGYLRTPLAAGHSPQQQAAAYAALLDALDIEYVVVVGLSGGGPSALAFAGLYPERVVALVMLEAIVDSITLDPPSGWLASDPGVWLALSTANNLLGEQDLVRMLLPDPDNQQRVLRSPQATREIFDMMWGMWPPSQRLAGYENDRQQFVKLDLPLDDIRAPTLILHGTADTAVPYYHAQLLARILPRARLHTIEGADHYMPLTHRGEVTETIVEFLTELAAAGQ